MDERQPDHNAPPIKVNAAFSRHCLTIQFLCVPNLPFEAEEIPRFRCRIFPRELYYACELKLSQDGCQSKKGNSGPSVTPLAPQPPASELPKEYYGALVGVAGFAIRHQPIVLEVGWEEVEELAVREAFARRFCVVKGVIAGWNPGRVLGAGRSGAAMGLPCAAKLLTKLVIDGRICLT